MNFHTYDRFRINSRHFVIFIAIMLTISILSLYWRVQNYDFINLDDPVYVTANYQIQSGIDLTTISAAFTDLNTSNWHPVTMMSHMLDWQMFGANAGSHHWTNVMIHIFNTTLLFILFRIMTGALWRSAFVAALFAIHPLNVESVAWISERKNVLSTFFFVSSVLLYVWYLKFPDWKRYLLLLVSFTFGLMSKPMLVTLPFVLLLLDYWPLNRWKIDSERDNQPRINKTYNLIIEKIPLFAFSAISSCITIYAARDAGTVYNFDALPFGSRISNAVVSYASYVRKLFWPRDLAVFYPYSDIAVWKIFASSFLIGGVTIFACRFFRKYPYLFIGWFWYLGTLVPVIGLIQVGSQAMADRYVYVPMIGIYIMMSWGISEMFSRLLNGKLLVILISSFFILHLASVTYHQVGTWKNNHTLFDHAIRVNPQNYQAYSLLGLEMAARGEYEDAIYYQYMALKYKPKFYPAYNYAGTIFQRMGRIEDSISCYTKALQINDKFSDAHYNLGIMLIEQNRINDAIIHFKKALETTPNDPDIHNNLGVSLLKAGSIEEARTHFLKSLSLNPNGAVARKNLQAMTTDNSGNRSVNESSR